MADFKCRECGNLLHPAEGQTIIQCNRCDSTMLITLSDNAKKQRLLREADELRFQCQFDRALAKYESVIQEFPKDADAYWGYVLCSYGVEFQENTRTQKKQPTLHRLSNNSVLLDPYYKKAIEYAHPIQADEYKRIAGELEHIRVRFLELSQKEENRYDIFISFKQTEDRLHRETVDCSKAENLYHRLKEMGYRVFFSKITLSNRGGDDYEPIIYTALLTARVMLVIGSCPEYLEAPWVRNEWSRYLDMMGADTGKKLLPLYFDDMTPERFPDALRGIQGYDITSQRGIDRVEERIRQLIPRKADLRSNQSAEGSAGVVASQASLLKRARVEAEGHRWKNAEGYYNKILEADPECAEAWIGLMLTANDPRFVDLEEYESYLLQSIQNAETTQRFVTEKESGDDNLFAEYEVENYFSQAEIAEILPENLVYESQSNALSSMKRELSRRFESDSYFLDAVRYAKGDYAQKLAQFREKVMNAADSALEESIRRDTVIKEQLRKEYAGQLQAAKRILEEKHKHALAQRESDYQMAVNIHSSAAVPEGIALLDRVGEYKDAPQKLQDMVSLNSLRDTIGNGSTFLAEQTLQQNPGIVSSYQTALSNYNGMPSFGIKNSIVVGVYCIAMLIFMLAGNTLALGLVIAGFLACGLMWNFGQPKIAYPVLAVFHMIAGYCYSSQWVLILLVFYCFSFFRTNGCARLMINKKSAKLALNRATKEIQTYEGSLRDMLNSIWTSTIGVDYDGVQLSSVLEVLDKGAFSLQAEASTCSTDMQSQYIQQNEIPMSEEAFDELFNQLWNENGPGHRS